MVARARKGELPLAQLEEVPVPARLAGGLELGQIEVDALAPAGLRAAGVEERQRGAEERGVHGRAVDGDIGLVEMQTALAVHEERQVAVGDLVVRGSARGRRRRARGSPRPGGCGRSARVSISRWPPESSSSSRSPAARSPSGPGFSALMNIEVIEQGPEISMPGCFKSSGTGGTCHVPVLATLAGGWPGGTCCRRARSSTASRRARSSRARAVQLIVEARQIFAEGGREQRRRPFYRGELHSRRHQH